MKYHVILVWCPAFPLCIISSVYCTVYKYLPEEGFVASCEVFPGGDCLRQAHTDAHHVSAIDTNKWQPSTLRIFWGEENV
jgi:hypothetical protein